MLATDLASSVEGNVIGGLVVVSLAAIAGIGVKMLSGQRRVHEALFGFKEGERTEPGIVDIVKGNGHGSLLDICERAEQQSIDNGAALTAHVRDDEVRWDAIHEALKVLAPDAAPAKKTAARKRAAPKKVAAA